MAELTKKAVGEWLRDEQITIIECDLEDFDNDKVVDEYEFWITIGYHCTAMRVKNDNRESIKDTAAKKLKQYLDMATDEEKRKILSQLKYIPIKALSA